MARIKDLYDEKVITNIVKSYSDDAEVSTEPKEDPYVKVEAPTFKVTKGTVLFSKLFGWEPTIIPDIPIRVFKDTDWDERARLMIPAVNPHWIWNREAVEELALALHLGDTTLIHGLMGTGKSCLVEQWCALCIVPFWRMSCNRETREQHFLGSPGVEHDEKGQLSIKQEPTTLTDSLRYGGIFCEDEAFRHNSALVLQSLREKSNRTLTLPDAPGRTANERRLVAPVGKWWYVLTDNTVGSGDETGIFDAEVQDASTLDRIDTAIEVDYLSKDQERQLLQSVSGLNEDIVNGMLDFAKLTRAAFTKQTIMSTLSARGLLGWTEKTEILGDVGMGLQLSWYNKLGSQDQRVVKDIYHQVFAKQITDKAVTNEALDTSTTS